MRVAQGFDIFRQVDAENPPGRPSPARNRLWREAIKLAMEEKLVAPAYAYDIVPLDEPARPGDTILRVKGKELVAPKLIPETGQLTELAFGVGTLGSAIEARISSLFAEKRASLAVMLDELGNHLLFAVFRRSGDRMYADVRKRGLTMAGELHAGDPGLDLSAQKLVLEMAHSHLIGVDLKGGHLMRPMKSGSVVFGVGVDLPSATWSRCDECPSREKCTVVDSQRGDLLSSLETVEK